MADGFSQATNKPAFVNLHTSAGTGNAMCNIMTAFQNKTPLIITAGQQTREMILGEPLLTNRDETTLPRPWVKWAYQPVRAQDVPARSCGLMRSRCSLRRVPCMCPFRLTTGISQRSAMLLCEPSVLVMHQIRIAFRCLPKRFARARTQYWYTVRRSIAAVVGTRHQVRRTATGSCFLRTSGRAGFVSRDSSTIPGDVADCHRPTQQAPSRARSHHRHRRSNLPLLSIRSRRLPPDGS